MAITGGNRMSGYCKRCGGQVCYCDEIKKKLEKLKPCPHCGGRAKIFSTGVGWDSGVQCKCANIYFFRNGQNVGLEKDGAEQIIKVWNKRIK
jgi:hypothetical protein